MQQQQKQLIDQANEATAGAEADADDDVDDDNDGGIKRFMGLRDYNDNNRQHLPFSRRQARAEVFKLTPFDSVADANATQQQQQQQEKVEQQQNAPHEPIESEIFGLTGNLESSLDYTHVFYSIFMQIDDAVLVFLIVMLICGIVYACEFKLECLPQIVVNCILIVALSLSIPICSYSSFSLSSSSALHTVQAGDEWNISGARLLCHIGHVSGHWSCRQLRAAAKVCQGGRKLTAAARQPKINHQPSSAAAR